jgi:hypothetical protein
MYIDAASTNCAAGDWHILLTPDWSTAPVYKNICSMSSRPRATAAVTLSLLLDKPLIFPYHTCNSVNITIIVWGYRQ